MKELIFRIILAGLIAFGITRLALWIDTSLAIHEKWIIPDILWWLESHSIVLKKVFFWVLFVILAITNAGLKLGKLLLISTGVVVVGAILIAILFAVIEICGELVPLINSWI